MMHETLYETMPRSELEVFQLERLQSTLNRAYLNVAHYRRALDGAGILLYGYGPNGASYLAEVTSLAKLAVDAWFEPYQ